MLRWRRGLPLGMVHTTRRATTGVGGAEMEGSVVDRGSTQGCGEVRPGEGHGYRRQGEGDGEDRGRAAPHGASLCVYLGVRGWLRAHSKKAKQRSD